MTALQRGKIIAELSGRAATHLSAIVTHLQRMQQFGTVLSALDTRRVRDEHVHYLVRVQEGLTVQVQSAPDIVTNEAQLVAHVWNVSC